MCVCVCGWVEEIIDYRPHQVLSQYFTVQVPRAICVCLASCLQSNIYLAAGTMRATCTHGNKHAGDGNQFFGVVELPEGVIIELELGIDRKPTNMRLKMLIETKLAEQSDKYLYSSHKRDNFGGLVRSSDFA